MLNINYNCSYKLVNFVSFDISKLHDSVSLIILFNINY